MAEINTKEEALIAHVPEDKLVKKSKLKFPPDYSKKIKKVFFDMDGVLVNLEEQFETIERRSIGRIMEEVKLIDKTYDPIVYLIKKYIHMEPFIQAAPKDDFDLAMALINQLINEKIVVEILSSSTRQPEASEVTRQKRVWLTNNGLDIITHNFALGASEKIKWATEDSLLIDDMVGNIESFRKAGASAIYHRNFRTTIQELGLYLPFVKELLLDTHFKKNKELK